MSSISNTIAEANTTGCQTNIALDDNPPARLSEVVEALCEACTGGPNAVFRGARRQPLPSRNVVNTMIEQLRSVLFPGYFGTSEIDRSSIRFHVGASLDQVLHLLREQVHRGLCFQCPQDAPNRCSDCAEQADQITRSFLARLPEVQRQLATDVTAAYQGDPAATSPDEAVFCYPGLLAITNYRLAHELHLLQVPIIPRIITEQAHSTTGIDIHPGATIGDGLFIDHGTGVVVGETCEIGEAVRIYQGVTLGAKSFPLDDDGNPVKGIARHPIVEDRVTIYSGATILGRIRLGRGSVIGGNVWLTRSIPPDSRISQAQLRHESFTDGSGI